jgi:hypothetical protein
MEKLIKFCPHCGHKNKEGERYFEGKLPNGGDWVCGECDEHVEAYVLSK